MKNGLIIALSIVVLCLGGYLVYDKIIVNDDNNGEVVDNNESDKESNVVDNVMSDEDAYSIGKSLLDYGYEAIYGNKFEHVSTYTANLGYEILNYEEVSSKFTDDSQVKYLASSSTYTQFGSNLTNSGDKYYDANLTPGRGANQSYISSKLNIVEKDEKKITFNAVSGYCIDTGYDPFDSTYECKNIDYKTYEFIIEKENNEWKIARITLPY